MKQLAMSVLAHRVILTADALLREDTPEAVTERIIQRVKVPTGMRGDVEDPEQALTTAVG